MSTHANASSDGFDRVEALLMEHSARFVGLASEYVDNEIHDALRRICEDLGFDRSSFLQRPPGDPDAFILTHMHQRSNMPPPPPGTPDVRPLFPWSMAQLRQGKTVMISDLKDLPAEAGPDKDSLRKYGTNSVGCGSLGKWTPL